MDFSYLFEIQLGAASRQHADRADKYWGQICGITKYAIYKLSRENKMGNKKNEH